MLQVRPPSHIHNLIIILSQVYNEPIQRPAPSWLVSLIGRALHWYRRGQGFESRTSLNFSGFLFTAAKLAYITAMIILHLRPHLYYPEALRTGLDIESRLESLKTVK